MMCHLFYEFSCVSQQHRDVRFYFLIFFNKARLLFSFFVPLWHKNIENGS